MRHSVFGGILAFSLLASVTGTSVAQETFTPVFHAPYRAFQNHEFGASLSDPEFASVALEGFYRYGQGPNDFGVRLGFADAEVGDAIILVGGNFRTRVLSYSESFPLDGALTLGLGGLFGEGDDIFAIPLGLSLGRRFDLEGSNTTFVPFVHPVIVPTFGGGDDDVNFALGLGVNVNFSERWAVRASGGLGDIEGVGISVAYVR